MAILKAKKWRKKILLAKVETTEQTDASPSGSANAILATNVSITPLEGSDVSRNLDRPFLGNQPSVMVGEHVVLQFDVEAAGSGAGGTAPKWGVLHKGCGMAETVSASASIQASPASYVGTPSGRFTYVMDDPYAGTVHRRVTLEVTTAGPSATAAFSVTAPAMLGQNAYSATAQVMTDATSFALLGGATITPTVTTDFVLGDKFTIDLYPARTRYTLLSADEDSLSFHLNIDGTLHKMTGARGSLSLVLEPQTYGKWRYRFLGIYVGPVADALPAGDFTGFKNPEALRPSTVQTAILHGYAGVFRSVTVDQANQVNYRPFLNQESIVIGYRLPTAQVSMLWPGLAAFDPFTAARAKTTGALELMIGSAAGKVIRIEAPKVELSKPTYVEDQGDTILQVEAKLLPDAGNDDFTIYSM